MQFYILSMGLEVKIEHKVFFLEGAYWNMNRIAIETQEISSVNSRCFIAGQNAEDM